MNLVIQALIKKIKSDEQKVRLLNFVDVFKNQYLTNETPTMVVTASDKKILSCNILKGDVFITPSSEIIGEIGQSAVVIEDIENAVYSYHIMRLRIYDKTVLMPEFLNYLFQAEFLKRQIKLNAQGITRFGLTQPKWKSLQIPIPPLSVQSQIVQILDAFTELTEQLRDELTAELAMRQKQYHYYRDLLLTFDEKISGGGRIILSFVKMWFGRVWGRLLNILTIEFYLVNLMKITMLALIIYCKTAWEKYHQIMYHKKAL